MHTARCMEIGFSGSAQTVLLPREAAKAVASGTDVDAGIQLTRQEALVMHAPSGAVLSVYYGASGDSSGVRIVPVPADGYWRGIPWADISKITVTSAGIVYLWAEDLSTMECKQP